LLVRNSAHAANSERRLHDRSGEANDSFPAAVT
jgi:hypothetical protein